MVEGIQQRIVNTLVAAGAYGLLIGLSGSTAFADDAPLVEPPRLAVAKSRAEIEGWGGHWLGPESLSFDATPIGDAEAIGAKPTPPPLTKEYMKGYLEAQQRFREINEGKLPPRVAQAQSRFQGCPQPTMPGYMVASEYPYELIVHDRGIYLFNSIANDAVRRIYTDGRKHPGPDDIIENPMGHSIGHWEGKALVVDTIGMPAGRIDMSAQHSDQLHITEHWRMLDHDTIKIVITLEDPKALTKPWSSTLIWKRAKEQETMYNPCIEGQRNL